MRGVLTSFQQTVKKTVTCNVWLFFLKIFVLTSVIFARIATFFLLFFGFKKLSLTKIAMCSINTTVLRIVSISAKLNLHTSFSEVCKGTFVPFLFSHYCESNYASRYSLSKWKVRILTVLSDNCYLYDNINF